MVSLGAVIGFAVIIGIHTAIAAVLIRFFRLRLATRWGTALFALFFVPLALVVSLLIVGQFPVFSGIGRDTVMMVTILLPLLLGFAIDLFWMPAPEDVELARQEQ